MADPMDDSAPANERLMAAVRDVLAPLVAADGGVLEWVGVTHGVAEVRLSGNCAGCPGQTFTANSVLLPALRAVDPSIRSVRVKQVV